MEDLHLGHFGPNFGKLMRFWEVFWLDFGFLELDLGHLEQISLDFKPGFGPFRAYFGCSWPGFWPF